MYGVILEKEKLIIRKPNSGIWVLGWVFKGLGESASKRSFNWRTGNLPFMARSINRGSFWTKDPLLLKGFFLTFSYILEWEWVFCSSTAQIEVLSSARAWIAWLSIFICCLWKAIQHLIKPLWAGLQLQSDIMVWHISKTLTIA